MPEILDRFPSYRALWAACRACCRGEITLSAYLRAALAG